uniref:Peptidase M24 domain-containing protein n=1 Tax=Fusarium oxysporum (strain Fo5176) TaxID=660025 RepID=A0A0D2XD86_FUSOF
MPIMSSETKETDYSLANPDTLTKYKTAAQISEKVLAEVSKLVVPGAKIVDICQQGDKLIEEEVAKVYRGKKINKGFSHPTTVSPSSYVTPYTPLTSDEAEANTEIKDGEAIKIQLGAQIDGFRVPLSVTP